MDAVTEKDLHVQSYMIHRTGSYRACSTCKIYMASFSTWRDRGRDLVAGKRGTQGERQRSPVVAAEGPQ
jgi:hypothetical protein